MKNLGIVLLVLLLGKGAAISVQPDEAVASVGGVESQRSADWLFDLENVGFDLYWKQSLESNLLWMIHRLENPQAMEDDAPMVAVYADAGVWPLGVQSIVAALETSGVRCEVLDWSGLRIKNLKCYDALIVPGGYAWFEKLSAGEKGEHAIREYVAGGGRYLGICAGAYFASKDVHWEGGKFPYQLQLFDGIAEGAIDEIAAWPSSGDAVVHITKEGGGSGLDLADGLPIYYSGGCRFIGGSGVSILANYADGTAAVIRRRFGPEKKGTVVLTGVHFERPASSGVTDLSMPSQSPPVRAAKIFSQLLDLELPRPDATPTPIELKPFASSVTAETTNEQWRTLQRTLRLRLNELRKVTEAAAEPMPESLLGDWSLKLESGEAGWLSVAEKDGEASVAMMVNVGSIKPLKGVEVLDGKIHVPLRTFRKGKKGPIISQNRAVFWSEAGGLQGEIFTSFADTDKAQVRDSFIGKRIPPMPHAPDLSKVKFGEPAALFNRQDLSGWRLRRPDKNNGWSVEDGELVNTTPKTDFNITGAYGNLCTEGNYGDGKLHIEFLIEKDRNSGIYVRGMYEAQVVDRDSRMQGLQGVGSIFGLVERSENSGKVGGEWQSYDITLVDRHVTVVLNGVKVIDNQPVSGPTSGAMHTDPVAPGPLYLQGDHTSVKYRNIVFTPVAE